MVKEVIPQFPEAHQASWREQAESWRLPFNDTKHFTNPATPPAFRNFKKEPTITGGADGALDAELKQPKIDPPPPR
ncbi:hypothetical protein PENNAL_c0099G10377 [Penicillium nalgiovense]|uniref:Uncharacterized protein n=1 Tax=Penicillium nalgiovense TaxID=60175 RepID=A0A1V6XAH2_PENNA|nr:hypothetical protein PENNAL_c0099G10377 [Penicillium nalgiovense]